MIYALVSKTKIYQKKWFGFKKIAILIQLKGKGFTLQQIFGI